MKADISTLHKQDILILRRQRNVQQMFLLPRDDRIAPGIRPAASFVLNFFSWSRIVSYRSSRCIRLRSRKYVRRVS
jgi:hypothetical protein